MFADPTDVIDLSFLDDGGPILLDQIQPWDPDHARRTMEAANDLVEQLSVSGHDPVIVRAADRACRGYYTQDLEGTIAGCADVCRRTRELATETGCTANPTYPPPIPEVIPRFIRWFE
jgi:hypothetical protein